MNRFLVLTFIYLFAGAIAFAEVSVDKNARLVISDYSAVKPGTKIKMRDIVLETNNIESHKILELVLADAPKAGEKIRFSNSAISQAIAHFMSSLKNANEHIRLQEARIIIPNEVIVQGAGWASSYQKLKQTLVAKYSKLCDSHCEIEIDNLTAPKAKPSFNESTEYELLSVKVIPKGSFNEEVQIIQNGSAVEKAWVQGRVRIFKTVPVATRLLRQGERLTELDFEIKKVDVTMEMDTTPAPKTLVGAKLSRTLNPQQIILNSTIERERDVVFGQPVQAVIRNPNWTISLEAVARDSGSVGDRIKIYNSQSKKTLSGLLVSKGVVEIQQ